MSALAAADPLVPALERAMLDDPAVLFLAEGGGSYPLREHLADVFGAVRCVSLPLGGPGLAAVAQGAALGGARPVVWARTAGAGWGAFHALVHLVAVHRPTGRPAPTVLRIPPRSTLDEPLGGAAVPYRAPGLAIVAPASLADARSLLAAALRAPGPVVFLDPGAAEEGEAGEEAIGQARLARPGRDLSLVTWGAMLSTALEAAERLSAEGIDAEVLELRTLEPLDEAAILATVQATGRVLVVAGGPQGGSLAGAVAAHLGEVAFEWLDGPVSRLSRSGAGEDPESNLPNVEELVARARQLARY